MTLSSTVYISIHSYCVIGYIMALWHHSTYCTTVRTILSHLHVLYTARTIYTAHRTYSTCSLFPCFRCWGFIFNICSLSHVLIWLKLYYVFTYKCSLSVIHFCALRTNLVLSAHHHRGSVTISILDEYHFNFLQHLISVVLLNQHFEKDVQLPRPKKRDHQAARDSA